MRFTWYHELFWFLGAAALPAWLAMVSLTAKRSAAERSLGWILACQSTWVVGQALELAATGRDFKLWLDGLQYFPMCGGFAWTLVFAHHFAAKPLNRWLIGFYCFLTFPACVFYATAPLHGLARQDAQVIAGVPFDTLAYQFTAGDDFLIFGSFVASILATAIAASRLARVHRAHVSAAFPVLFGISLPTLVIVPSVAFDWTLLGQRDISFAVFGIGGLAILWGLRRGRTAVVPVARDVLFDRSPDPALVVDRDGAILELNSAALNLLQLPNKTSAIMTRLDTLDAALVNAKQLAALVGSTAPQVLPTTGGRCLRVESHHLADLDVHLVVARDVTDEVAADTLRRDKQHALEQLVELRNQALVTTERKFRGVFERSFQMMFLLSADGTVLDANRAALDATKEPGNVVGKAFWLLPMFARSTDLQTSLRKAIETAARVEQVRLPVLQLGDKHKPLALDLSLTPIVGQDGTVTTLICEGRDVTDLERAQDQLRQASKMEALGTLASGVAHDFNNLLTVILGHVSFLRETHLQDDLESLDEVERASTHAAVLTQQLLAFGRKSMLTPKTLKVTNELDAAMRMLARVIPENISLRLHVADDVGNIVFDSTQFHQIVLNLAINARDAMPNGGTLELRAQNTHQAADENSVPQDWVQLVVSDTGVGMSEETRARIFEPFFTTKELGRGTGLGLAMVYGAVMQHGGFMQVSSEVGRGTSFALYLKHDHAQRQEVFAASGMTTVSPLGTIYVVEDQLPILRTVAGLLSRAGHTVRTFDKVEELLGDTQLACPSLLLTDAVMPRVSGLELVQKLRVRWPNLPCIVMSGYSDERLVQEAQAQGIQFIQKPFVGDELQRKVREALSAQSALERTVEPAIAAGGENRSIR